MILSIIVAASENDVIGKDNGLIWHLSADLKRFKKLTTGHTVIMGRKLFESIGKALRGRRNVVVTRNPSFSAAGVERASGIQEALDLLGAEEEAFIIGGGTLYNAFWNKADRLYLTRVRVRVEGDTRIPPVREEDWLEVFRENGEADERNKYPYSFIDYRRNDHRKAQ